MAAIKRAAEDAAFSDAIRLAKDYTCEHCSKVGGKSKDLPQIDCAHIYGRRFKSVRWDAMNALCLCHTCHREFTESPLDFEVWLKSYLGHGYLEILNEKRNQILKVTKSLRSEIAKHYRAEVKRMTETGCRQLVSWS